jgi:thiol-disulfide isomerase/thioredoxin
MSKRLRATLVTLAIAALGLIISGCTGNSEPTGAVTGQPAPDFELQNLDGEMISLYELDRAVFLNFWNTGCPPCVEEMPLLQQAFEDNQANGPLIATVNVGESAATVRGFVDDVKNQTGVTLDLPMLLDRDVSVARDYGIQFFPTTFLIDQDGIIQEKIIGAFPDLEAIETRLVKIRP